MLSEASVTTWIGQLKAGEQAAAQPLWERYFEQLVRLARQRLGETPRRAADEEDVALSAFENFCRGAREGRFPRLNDRHDLWQILVMLTERKAKDQVRRALTRERIEVGESKFTNPLASTSDPAGVGQLADSEPTPQFAAQVAEEYQRLLDSLGDDTLRKIARWKMEGYTEAEIAKKLGRTTRTVERKLQMIRQRWQALCPEEMPS